MITVDSFDFCCDRTKQIITGNSSFDERLQVQIFRDFKPFSSYHDTQLEPVCGVWHPKLAFCFPAAKM